MTLRRIAATVAATATLAAAGAVVPPPPARAAAPPPPAPGGVVPAERDRILPPDRIAWPAERHRTVAPPTRAAVTA